MPNNRTRKPSGEKWHKKPRGGKTYAEFHALDSKITRLETEIREHEAKIARCEIVFYEGKEYTFYPFWTRSPSAHKRPIIIEEANEPVKARHA